MVIEVCKQKLESAVWTVFRVLSYMSIGALFITGSYGVSNNLWLASDGESLGWAFIMIGSIALFCAVFLKPWLDDEPHYLSKINTKYNLFKWNRKC